LPTIVLFHERFPLAEPLATLKIPKLLISSSQKAEPSAFVTAATPKLTASLPSLTGPLYSQTVTRFLDQYVAASSPQFVPSVAPAATKLH
jgi:hypothetical protein